MVSRGDNPVDKVAGLESAQTLYAELLANHIKKLRYLGVVKIHKREPIASSGVPLPFETRLGPSSWGGHNPFTKCV